MKTRGVSARGNTDHIDRHKNLILPNVRTLVVVLGARYRRVAMCGGGLAGCGCSIDDSALWSDIQLIDSTLNNVSRLSCYSTVSLRRLNAQAVPVYGQSAKSTVQTSPIIRQCSTRNQFYGQFLLSVVCRDKLSGKFQLLASRRKSIVQTIPILRQHSKSILWTIPISCQSPKQFCLDNSVYHSGQSTKSIVCTVPINRQHQKSFFWACLKHSCKMVIRAETPTACHEYH